MAKFWRHTFYGLTVILVGIFIYLLLQNKDGQSVALFAAFICLIAARFDDLIKFKLSKDGLEGEMRQVIYEAKATVEQLHALAVTQSRLILWSMQAQGRWDGISFDSMNEMRDTVVSNLTALGVKQAKIDEVLSVEYRYTDFDHFAYVTSAVDMLSLTLDATTAWTAYHSSDLRKGIGTQPTPDNLEAFLVKWNLASGEVQERLTDYRHYLSNRAHRRPEVWKSWRG